MITPYRRQATGRAKPRGKPFAVNRFGEGTGPEPGNTIRAAGPVSPDPLLVDDKLTIEWYANSVLQNASYMVTAATESLASVLGKLATQCQANATVDVAVVVGGVHIDLTGSPTHYLQNARQLYVPGLEVGNTVIIDGSAVGQPAVNGTLGYLNWTQGSTPETVSDSATGDTARADFLEQLAALARADASVSTAVVVDPAIHLTAAVGIHIKDGSITADLPTGGNTVIATGGHLPSQIHNGDSVSLDWTSSPSGAQVVVYNASGTVNLATVLSNLATLAQANPTTYQVTIDSPDIHLRGQPTETLSAASMTYVEHEGGNTIVVDGSGLPDTVEDGGKVVLSWDAAQLSVQSVGSQSVSTDHNAVAGFAIISVEYENTTGSDVPIATAMADLETKAEAHQSIDSATPSGKDMNLTAAHNYTISLGLLDYTPPTSGATHEMLVGKSGGTQYGWYDAGGSVTPTDLDGNEIWDRLWIQESGSNPNSRYHIRFVGNVQPYTTVTITFHTSTGDATFEVAQSGAAGGSYQLDKFDGGADARRVIAELGNTIDITLVGNP